MRAIAKGSCLIGLLAAVVLTASVADARHVNTKRFGGAHASVSDEHGPGSIPYDAEGKPFPTGHGGTSASPDFQLMRLNDHVWTHSRCSALANGCKR